MGPGGEAPVPRGSSVKPLPSRASKKTAWGQLLGLTLGETKGPLDVLPHPCASPGHVRLNGTESLEETASSVTTKPELKARCYWASGSPRARPSHSANRPGPLRSTPVPSR